MTIINRIKSFLSCSNDISYHLYGAVVTQARSTEFYSDAGVPDNMDGRFDMVVMHSFLAIRRLNKEGEAGKEIAQQLFDDMFVDMDRSLREVGVGDLSIPKKIKVMAKAFYGRCSAYESAMDAGDRAALADVIGRNIFTETDPPEGAIQALTGYMFEVETDLKNQDTGQLLQGEISFPQFTVQETGQV